MPALLEVENLRKVYQVPGGKRGTADLVAVDRLSFQVQAGASLAIVGESGSGKTTTARLIAGLRRQRKQSRLVNETLKSLRQLKLVETAG